MRPAETLIQAAHRQNFASFFGEITSIGQKSLAASGPLCSVGAVCQVGSTEPLALAEVVAVKRDRIELLPFDSMHDARPGDRVMLSDRYSVLPVGDGFAGRAINALGDAIDGGPTIVPSPKSKIERSSALAKTIVRNRISTGVRAIDSLIPIAQGQRIGVFAASGVGKTTLIEQLSTQIECDKIVICLIGERGREVERLWDMHNDGQGDTPVTIVAATSEESPILRVRAVQQALALCENWRDLGEHVVLLLDSATRLAMALREIGLVAGEPPALRSYTPNVFSALPEFVERCGAIKGKGAITAIFTVLAETDDVDDPIVETMKSLLDGHIVLSRTLAERGHYPAIDVRMSVSRVADQILDASALDAAHRFKKMVATYEEARPMIDSGIYQEGANAEVDHAITLRPHAEEFLTQKADEQTDFEASDAALRDCLAKAAR